MDTDLSSSFWSRMGLHDHDRDVCVRAIQGFYPDYTIEEFGVQGYCSFTLLVSPCPGSFRAQDEYVVQLRPEQHGLDRGVAEAAREMYGLLAPRMRTLDCKLPGGLQAVEMERLAGTPLSRVEVGRGSWEKQVRLVESFARVVARAWPTSVGDGSSRYEDPFFLCLLTHVPRRSRADSPTEGLWLGQHCTGKVGRVIVPKLRKLAAELPDEMLRARARDTLARVLAIEHFPAVLNHGDLIPSNILVDEESWTVCGLVDWAEAEIMPFGACFYGLEYLFGGLETVTSADATAKTQVWRYRPGCDALRDMFWQTLVTASPMIKESVDEVRCMRDVGVLLWFGYAWDDGAIDRVVNDVVSINQVCDRVWCTC